jgi:DNA-binding response OmpR family regulator
MAADYYVVKSFDLSELKEMIKRAVEEHKPGHLPGS